MSNNSKRDKKSLIKIIGFIMVAMASSLFLFVFLVSTIRESRNEGIQTIKNAQFDRIYSELQILRSQAYDKCAVITKDIENDLRQLDLDELKSNMDAGVISDEMYEVIEKYAKGVSLNNIDNRRNGIVVMTQNGVLEDFNYERASKSDDSDIRSWDTELEKAWNKDLEQDAINKILLHKSDQLIAMEKNDMGDGHIMISEMNRKVLYEVYMAEGIEGLKNYQFKVACYITESGDIFGQEDIVHGVKQQNHKIIIVQEFNLYDQLYRLSPDIFEKNDQESQIDGGYCDILNITYILGILFISCIIILLFYFSHMYNYNVWVINTDKYDEETDRKRSKIINGHHK